MNKSRTSTTRKLQIISEPHEESLQLDMFNFVSDYALADFSNKAKIDRITHAKKIQSRPAPLESQGVVDENKNFSNFCEGQSNHLALEAVKRFIQDDNSAFRLFFLKAESGVGKTHILHAIANELKNKSKVFYLSSPLIMFPLTDNFNKLQSYSHLLIDDLEEVEENSDLQRIFCQLMDYAQSGKIKIIFTSHKKPKDFHHCEDRFKGKLSACLVHEIAALDNNLALKIIQSKDQAMGLKLPESLKDLLAHNFDYNVYGLESVLLKLKSKSEITNCAVTTEMALAEINVKKSSSIDKTHEELFKIVATAFEISLKELTSNVRRKSFALARHVCMFILKEKKGLSLKQISEIFGNDHTTVIYAVARIKREQISDLKLRDKVQNIIQAIS